MIKNYMEVIVDDMLHSLLEEHLELCSCISCIEDVSAIALNKLKPFYVASNKGTVFARLYGFEAQVKADVLKELAQAITIVRGNPRHHCIER